MSLTASITYDSLTGGGTEKERGVLTWNNSKQVLVVSLPFYLFIYYANQKILTPLLFGGNKIIRWSFIKAEWGSSHRSETKPGTVESGIGNKLTFIPITDIPLI